MHGKITAYRVGQSLLRQHRTIRGVRLACILFRQSALKSAPIRQYANGLFVHPDEKSDYAIRTPELCGIALNINDLLEIEYFSNGKISIFYFFFRKNDNVLQPLLKLKTIVTLI